MDMDRDIDIDVGTEMEKGQREMPKKGKFGVREHCANFATLQPLNF